MSLESATTKRDLTLQYLREMALAHLVERSSGCPLGETLLYLRTLSRDDALISRALAGLESEGRIDIGSDRVARLAT